MNQAQFDSLIRTALSHQLAKSYASAEQMYRRGLAVQPNNHQVRHLLGVLLGDSGRLEAGIEEVRRAIALCPKESDYYSSLGEQLGRSGRFEEAVAAFEKSLQFNPVSVSSLTNGGIALVALGRFDRATDYYRRAALARPDDVTHLNLAHCLRDTGRLAEAIPHYRKSADAGGPKSADAKLWLANAMLLAGDFAAGWDVYENRWKSPRFPKRVFPVPQWDGSPLAGRTMLVHCEQGLGDMMQFVRYLPMIPRDGGRVVLLADPAVCRLFRSMPDLTVLGDDHTVPAPPVHVQSPLMSLPWLFKTRADSIPAAVPYLHPAEADEKRWADLLGPKTSRLRVGLVWAGTKTHDNDRNRSIPFETVRPLLDVPNVQWIGLQKGDFPSPGLHNLGPQLTDMADTAALVKQLDLVISVDTSVVHLAGSIAAPVWTLLPWIPDWRWLMTGEDSAWYPTMKLFRQDAGRDWSAVIGRVAAALLDTAGAG